MKLLRRRPRLQQFLPSLGFRDAVGTHTVVTQEVLRDHGIAGKVWAEEINPRLARRARVYTDYPATWDARSGDDVLLYQASTGSRGMADFLCDRREPKLVYYHNITPPELFEPYDAGAAMTLGRGREELKRILGRTTIALANSEYSAQDLRALGAPDIRVVPPYLPPGLDVAPNADHASFLRRTKTGVDVLFVGRVVPNKGHLHLLRAFAALRAGGAPGSRLFVVGQPGPEAYMRHVMNLRERLGSDGIVFTGSVSGPHLAAHYQEADVFLCLSEHEGFGLPLLEAMRADVPVIAYAAGAVEETLGGAGVLLRTLDPPLVAEVVDRIGSDEDLQQAIRARQRDRVAQIESAPRDDVLVRAVRAVIG